MHVQKCVNVQYLKVQNVTLKHKQHTLYISYRKYIKT